MKKYTSPSMELLEFEATDIVTASGELLQDPSNPSSGTYVASTGETAQSLTEQKVWSMWTF